VTKVLHNDINGTASRVLALRQELALTASKKFTAAVDSTCADGRFRGGFRFFGAHTGRWAGRGVQLHNLPREAFSIQEEQDFTIRKLKTEGAATATELKKLVRPMLVGPFTVVDYSAIEARVIAWLAGEQWALQAFADGRDIYVETAERMNGLTRFQGKIAVLALGFAGGIRSLKAMAGDREALMELAKPPSMVPGGGVRSLVSDPDIDRGLQRLVDQWRDANPNIVRLWRRIEERVRHGGPVGEHLNIRRSGEDMWLDLPSGRSIVYHGLRWERYRAMRNGKWKMEEGWRYDDPKKVGLRIPTYGGRLAENATQAVARDILAESLVRLEAAGVEVVAHVHDELISVYDETKVQSTLDEVIKLACHPPDWAEGLPIAATGFVTERYRKD
jgi:DNA polymerase